MLGKVLSFLGSSAFKSISEALLKAYSARLEATTTERKIEAEETISALEAQQQVLLKEMDRGSTAWIRPAFAFITIVFWAKLIIWDTVLGLGSTPDPGEFVMWFATLVPTFYFIGRTFEKVYK